MAKRKKGAAVVAPPGSALQELQELAKDVASQAGNPEVLVSKEARQAVAWILARIGSRMEELEQAVAVEHLFNPAAPSPEPAMPTAPVTLPPAQVAMPAAATPVVAPAPAAPVSTTPVTAHASPVRKLLPLDVSKFQSFQGPRLPDKAESHAIYQVVETELGRSGKMLDPSEVDSLAKACNTEPIAVLREQLAFEFFAEPFNP